MKLSILILAALPVVAEAQNTYPPDIDPITLSRLPGVTPADLDEEGRRLLAERPDFKPAPGPGHVNIYTAGRDLGIPSGETSPLGARNFQLAVLIAARELDQKYEWASHAISARNQGLEEEVINVVKFDRPVTGLSERDATMITFGRTLLRDNAVSSELWEKMTGVFGRRDTMFVLHTMAAYIRLGIILNAVDQQVPPHRSHEMLPPLDR